MFFRSIIIQITKVFLLWFILLASVSIVFGFAESIVQKYNDKLAENNAFPFTDLEQERFDMVEEAPFPSYHLYVDEDDFGYIMTKWDKERTLPVRWFTVDHYNAVFKNEKSLNFFAWNMPRIDTFEWELKLRGVNALTCGKKWFRIVASWFDEKFKSLCGSVYWIEDYILSELLEDKKNITQAYLMNYPHELKKFYVNWKFYGIYMTVPKLWEDYFEHNDIMDADPKKDCVFKVYKDFDIDSPLMGNLSVRRGYDAKQELLWSVELNYWDPDMCLEKLDELVGTINQVDPNIDDLKELINMPSVLFWGLSLITSRNYLWFSHNYLLVYHNWKFRMGNWDSQEFLWCQKNDPLAYKKYRDDSFDPKNLNKLFTSVLRWYEKEHFDKLVNMQTRVLDVLCNREVYENIKNYDLKHVMVDRYRWNLGHMRKIDLFWNDYVVMFEKAYKKEVSFVEFFKTFFYWFDSYFGFKG